jgi:hypothetical protein
MHQIEVNMRQFGLNTVKCNCGLMKYFEYGEQTQRFALAHANENAPASIQHFKEGEPVAPPPRSARPGRSSGGGINSSIADDGNYAYSRG